MDLKLIILIPTRNRAYLAKNAVLSVLSQRGVNFEVVISDNSIDKLEVSDLRTFCDELKDERLSYIRPEKPLSMTKHWEWATRKILKTKDFTHFTILTDRMVFKRSVFALVANITFEFPEKLITYCADEILEDSENWFVASRGTTERVFEIKNDVLISAFLELSWVVAFPTVLNSWVPKKIVEKVAANYDEIFSSIAPDFNFGFKVMDQEDSILYYDKAMLVSYAYKHSNGRSLLTGSRESNKDAKDFDKNIASEDVYMKSILPFCSTVVDAVLNEYSYIQKNSKRRNFPAVNQNKYRSTVIANVLALQNVELQSAYLQILRKEFGIRYYEFYVRGKYPFRRYVRRIIEEVLITIFRKEGVVSTKQVKTLDDALEYAMNTSGEKLKTLMNFYKRTSIRPSDVRLLPCGDAKSHQR